VINDNWPMATQEAAAQEIDTQARMDAMRS